MSSELKMVEKSKIEHLVVDTNTFIKNPAIQDLAVNIYTVQDVVDEITSKRQLRNLVVLPYNIVVKEVFLENIKFVTDFAKKTGDYVSLSATDIKVIALTYQLEKEIVGSEHLKSEPQFSRMINTAPKLPDDLGKFAGFYLPKKNAEELAKDTENIKSNDMNSSADNIKVFGDATFEITEAANITTSIIKSDEKSSPKCFEEPMELEKSEEAKGEESNPKFDPDTEEKPLYDFLLEPPSYPMFFKSTGSIKSNDDCSSVIANCGDTDPSGGDSDSVDGSDIDPVDDTAPRNENRSLEDTSDDDYVEEREKEENYIDDCEDQDEASWITPNNIQEMKFSMSSQNIETKPLAVACITSDFAMQNVLKQIGLSVTSVDGRLINQVRTFILRCYSCFKTTSIMTKVFCPNCGNKTLKRVAVTVKEDGTQEIYINTRRPLSGKGKRFSIPRLKGGKHSNDPILCEDQPVPQQKPSRLACKKNNPLDPDYIAGYSPFVMRDITSRAAMLGIHESNLKDHFRRNQVNKRRRRK